MTIIAGTLIREALIMSSVIGQFDEPEGFYALTGINLLNDIITQWGSLGVYIPYNSVYEFDTVANQTDYIVNQVIAELLEGKTNQQNQFPNNGVTSHHLRIATDKERYLFQTNVSQRPSYVYLDRQQIVVNEQTDQLGSLLVLNPVPDQVYTINLLLKYQLQVTSLFDELLNFPAYYLKPLRYQLTKDLSDMFKTKMSDGFYSEYERLITDLTSTNPSDLTIQNENPFLARRSFKPTRYYGYY